MDKNEIAPHVKEIARVLEGKVEESKIEEELENYLNVYRVSLDTAKRSVVKSFGGDPNALGKEAPRKIADIKGGEASVDILAKVVTVNPKEIPGTDGKPAKQIVYGIVADDTGSMSYTAWDPSRFQARPGDVVLIKNGYTREYNGRVDLNLGSRAIVEQRPKDDMQGGEMSIRSSYSAGPVKVCELSDGMNNVTVSGRILSVERREVPTEDGPKVVFSGILEDDTGRVQYSAWHDFDLKPNEVVKITNGYVKSWKGVPKLNFGEKATVNRLRIEDLPELNRGKPKPRTIMDIEKVGGATDAVVEGTIVDVREGSGLLKRCPQCKRVVQKGACLLHGKVNGTDDLRTKAVLDDGEASMAVIFNRAVTESVLGLTLEDCKRRAQEAMTTDVIKEMIEEKILAMPMSVRGNVLKDDYGLMMIVSEASFVNVDVKEEATKLLTKLEGFQ
ncbi:MAG: DNA-binding protein [Methanomassiliicoccales archaeon]|nr:MAG: DNA-binding protein [Methanomassiliicoccales archaeon]